MEIISLVSSSNSLLKRIRSLHDRSGREKTGTFLLEGAKIYDEAISHGIHVQDVVVTAQFLDRDLPRLKNADALKRVNLVDDNIFSAPATTESPQGLIAVASCRAQQAPDLFEPAPPLVVIADRIQDPGNLGTMVRTSLALGASGLILTKGSVDAYNPKVVRSAAGALFALPILQDRSIQEALSLCRQHGLIISALSADGASVLNELNLTVPSAILFGNEASGLDVEVEKQTDYFVRIPMAQSSESLNVSIAHAIVMYEAMTQRKSMP